jgi:glycosyltransferase involved in cell wall biosynthesis
MTHRPPRVLIVGGPDVDARLHLMYGLSADFEVIGVGSDPMLASKFSAAGFPYYHYRLSRQVAPISDLGTVTQLVRIFRSLRPHIVHTFDTKPGLWGSLAASLAQVPIVISTITGLGGSLSGNPGVRTRTAWWMYERLQTFACWLSDLTVFQNPDVARQFISARVVPSRKSTVILGSGVPTHLFDPSEFSLDERNQLKQELGIASGELVVTMISRLIRSKGIIEFSRAAREIAACHPKVRFLLVGPPDLASTDQPSPRELSELREAVNWIGPRKDVGALLAISDVFVFPSAYREGIPRVLLEAAAMALPIITTDLPGCREVVQDGVNGFLVPARDVAALTRTILRLLQQPELRRRFGQASRRRAVEKFDLSLVTHQTRSTYEQLLRRCFLPSPLMA